MTAKRAPGAGRKPKGPFKGKSATITTRVTPRTRAELERAAKRAANGKGHSLSQEIEIRLDDSLRKGGARTPAHIKALAQTVTLLAINIERTTGLRWCDDAFTGDALSQAIDFLLGHFAPVPEGQPALPPKIKEAAAKIQPELRESYGNPRAVAQMEAFSVISMIEAISMTKNAPGKHNAVPGMNFADPLGYEQILRDIGSGWQRNQKIWNKETKR
jgi:hypothetical protein